MGRFEKVPSSELQQALRETRRQYLAGRLTRPQQVKEVIDDNIEAGISYYPTASAEQPHSHTEVSEYQYMIKGLTEYLDLDTGETHRFVKGDFYVIRPGTRYAQRIKRDTEIFFFKHPGKNDKVGITADERVQAWLAEPLRATRTDYNSVPNAPPPNAICPAVAVALIERDKSVLLVKRRDNGKWSLPGGTLDFGEDIPTCAKREILEETGLIVTTTLDLVGTYSNPRNIVAYDDGETRQEFTLLFMTQVTQATSTPRLDDESTECQWFTFKEMTNLPMSASQRQRLNDLQDFLSTGQRNYR